MAAVMDGPTYLYRHFDAEGKLLYVGISLSAIGRLAQHKTASAWFDDIRNVTIEKFATRSEALDAETKAIKEEKPLHNISQVDMWQRRLQASKIEASEDELLQKVVAFNPMYSLYEAASTLKVSEPTLKRMIAEKMIGSVKQGPKTFVTGWQLIEYIEAISNAARGEP
jgi:predicted GIY-YIG superfamily endonuclease